MAALAGLSLRQPDASLAEAGAATPPAAGLPAVPATLAAEGLYGAESDALPSAPISEATSRAAIRPAGLGSPLAAADAVAALPATALVTQPVRGGLAGLVPAAWSTGMLPGGAWSAPADAAAVPRLAPATSLAALPQAGPALPGMAGPGTGIGTEGLVLASLGGTAGLLPDTLGLQDWLSASVADSLLERRYAVGEEQRIVEVRPGDTLVGLLLEQGIAVAEADAIVASLADRFDPRTLRAGQPITLTFAETGRERHLAALALDPAATTTLTVRRDGEDGFTAELAEIPVEIRPNAAAGTIRNSLYADANAAGVPDSMVAEVIRVLSHSVDFQRDLHDGDRFALAYEVRTLPDGRVVGPGQLLMARLAVSGRTVEMFRFESGDGTVDYYDRDGVSARRVLLRTPIDGARVSSGYGMRRHPILGYSRMHQGVDFAAPTGTPIFAAGDGRIEVLGTRSGYGKYIRIRHNGELSTAYAHLSRYADLAQGDRVRQGQIIGYVGATGQATGPHLHYEVIVGGAQVNPMSVDLPTGRTIEASERRRFEAQIAEIDALLGAADAPALIAMEVPLPGRRPPLPDTQAAEVPPSLLTDRGRAP